MGENHSKESSGEKALEEPGKGLERVVNGFSKRKLKVIVADDKEDVRKTMHDILTDEGCEVYCASNGIELSKLLSDEEDNFDACVLDLVMPDHSPLEAIEKMRKSSINVVLYTPYSYKPSDHPCIDRLHEEGRYFEKPLEPDAIRKRIVPKLFEGKDELKLKRILVIDDDAGFVDQFRRDLTSKANVEIDVAREGLKGVELAKSKKYDLIISSLVLSNAEHYQGRPVDGFEIARLLREANKDAPIITTARSAFVLPDPEARAIHFQKNELIAEGKVKADEIFNLIKNYNPQSSEKDLAAISKYPFYGEPAFEKAIDECKTRRASVKKDRIEELIANLSVSAGIPDLRQRVIDEVYHFMTGNGGRDKGFITLESGLSIVLQRTYTFRYIEKSSGVEDLESKTWQMYNENERKGIIVPFKDICFNIVEDERLKKARRGPYVIVFTGPTCSGKTTAAYAVEEMLNLRGRQTVLIGNIKTGEKRNTGEEKTDDENTIREIDEYVTDKEADKMDKDDRYTKYMFLGRRYYSKDGEILDALRQGKNVVLVRNIDGLKAAGDLVYRYEELNAKLISFKLTAGEEVLRGRLGARVEKNVISDHEKRRREGHLVKTLEEFAIPDAPWDFVVTTNRDKRETHKEIMQHIERIGRENPHLHCEFSNYARRIINKITSGRFDIRQDFEDELEPGPVVIKTDIQGFPDIEIVAAQNYMGVYTFYLSQFYSRQNYISRKREFLHYLEKIFKESAHTYYLGYEPNPISNLARTKVTVADRRKRLDDIALFTLRRGVSAEFAGSERHSVVFVCLEDRPHQRGQYQKPKIEGIESNEQK